MRNVDFILQNMMQTSIDALKPKTSIPRLIAASDLGYRTIEAAILAKHAQRLDKTQKSNLILDGDSLVPDHLKKTSRATKISQAARTLSNSKKTIGRPRKAA